MSRNRVKVGALNYGEQWSYQPRRDQKKEYMPPHTKVKLEGKQDFRKVWEFPLTSDSYGTYVFAKNGTMALTFEYGNNAEEQKRLDGIRSNVVDCLNGVAKCETAGRWNHMWCDFFLDGEYVFCVRGWGHLTGTGFYALGLSEQDAKDTQDDFINFIQSKLDEK